ncbi:MAG: pilus assembly protein [Sphingomonadaceae bacterium]|nr:pilus assembly protein [Sphingomonadaceae bacterium]
MLNFLKRLRRDNSGLAVVEFAVSLPIFMGLTVGGFETSHYAYVHMRLNQLTIDTADGAARMGEGEVLAAKKIDESQINDVFAGTIRQGESILLGGEHEYKDPGTGEVTLRGNALIILSSVEPVEDFDADDPKYRIRWQRCIGTADYFEPEYGTVEESGEIEGVGPEGRLAVPPDDGALMFVETHYFFRPLILNGFSQLGEQSITKTASMVVRDVRDYTGGEEGVYQIDGVEASSCAFEA